MTWIKKYWLPWTGFMCVLLLHLWQLGTPATLVSDEVYFVKDAQAYINGETYFDPHPPLGKLELSGVFSLFASTPFTWRILNAVGGALLVPLIWWIVMCLSRQRVAGAIVVTLLFLDGLLLVDSRLSMINVPYILYGLAALASVFKALDSRRPSWWLISAGVCIGLAVSVKWLAGTIIAPTILLWFWPKVFGQSRNPKQPPWTTWFALGSLLVLPIVIYWLVFRFHFSWLGLPETFFETNLKMLNYNLSVPSSGDPYANPWWGWLLLWQPFLYWAQTVGEKMSVIWSLPNPWLWWTGNIIFLFSLVRGWRQPATRSLNIFLLACWLPFGLIARVMYSYHTLPFDAFLLMLLAVKLGEWWQRKKTHVVVYVTVAALVFVWFLPWYINLPLSQHQHQLRQWLPNWHTKTQTQ